MNKQYSRTGSVLIMVVALLVLLALMGTAWIATSRQDRDASVQSLNHAQNSAKIEAVPQALVDEITRGVLATVANSYNTPSVFMPRNSYFEKYNITSETSYLPDASITNPNLDAFLQYKDDLNPGFPGVRPMPGQVTQYQFLASRAPVLNYGGVSVPYWPAISAPVVAQNSELSKTIAKYFDTVNPSKIFSADYEKLAYSTRSFESPLVKDNTWASSYTQRLNMYPSFDENMNPIFIFKSTADINGDGVADGKTSVLAADTDGDGIADAGFSRMPVAEADGTTTYVAIRILDANSAINLSTAGAPYEDYDYTNKAFIPPNYPNTKAQLDAFFSKYPTPLGNFFPSNVDLLSHLRRLSTDEFFELVRFRQNWEYLDPLAQAATTDLGSTDFLGMTLYFKTPWELMWRQIGSRTDFPGALPNGSGLRRYQSFPSSDEIVLLKHYLLPPENVNKAGVIGKVLPDTLLWSAKNSPYSPYIGIKDGSGNEFKAVQRWYDENFKLWDPATATLNDNYSRLPLFVTRNGTSIAAPLVNYGNISGGTITPFINAPFPLPYRESEFPVKANINTADFNHLWNAFWHVMAEDTRPQTLKVLPASVPYVSPTLLDLSASNVLGDTTPVSFIPPTRKDSTGNFVYIDPVYEPENRARQFKSSLRVVDPAAPADLNNRDAAKQSKYSHYRFLPQQMVVLRSAIAAVNALQMRSHNNVAMAGIDPVSKQELGIKLPLADGTIATVEIYGVRPQPVIGEIYVENNGVTDYEGKGRNIDPYIAVALYNPYPFEINISNWKIASVDRTSDQTKKYGVGQSFAILSTDSGNALAGKKVPAGGWLVLENFDASDKDPTTRVKARPKSEKDTPDRLFNINPASSCYVKNLSAVITDATKKELILLRPVNEGATIADAEALNRNMMIPVDSFDFTGFPTSMVEYTGKEKLDVFAYYWHYRRNCQGFKSIYPGKFDGSKGADLQNPRQEGTIYRDEITKVVGYKVIDKPTGAVDINGDPLPSTPVDKADLDLPKFVSKFSSDTGSPTFINLFPPIQLMNLDQPSTGLDFSRPDKITETVRFPFGGFPRNGDIMNVPFIGSYAVRIQAIDPKDDIILEMNPVTMDCAFAEDSDNNPGNNDNSLEHIGRFSPNFVRDFSDNPAAWRYRFANRLFDYLSVETPGDNTLAGAPAETTAPFTPASVEGMEEIRTHPNDRDITDPRSRLAGRKTGVNGLINLNTAPLAVLESIPFFTWNDMLDVNRIKSYLGNMGVPPALQNNFLAMIASSDSPYNPRYMNRLMAQAIINYREGGTSIARLLGDTSAAPYVAPGGTFKSILDLYRVPEFYLCANELASSSLTGPSYYDGDISPSLSSGATDNTVGDCEDRHMFFTRISNMITTRSDRFSGWILIQNWKDAGTPMARMVSQRRMGVIIDRNNVSTSDREPKVTIVPLTFGPYSDSN